MKTYPTQAELKALFDLDTETGVLRWKVNRRGGVKAGDVAGSIVGFHKKRKSKDRYWSVKINGQIYKNHRLIFIYMTGECPEFVDHIDGNSLNNKWNNLRAATVSENNHNRKIARNNTSGVKGVSFYKKDNRWSSKVVANSKTFRALFKTKDEAVAHQLDNRPALHGPYARQN